MSLYAQYIVERTSDHIIERPDGFATYRYVNDDRAVYIVDIFVIPEARKKGLAAEMADLIGEQGRMNGCKEMLGTVVPSSKNSTTSMKILLAYGMTLHSSSQDMIVLRKEL